MSTILVSNIPGVTGRPGNSPGLFPFTPSIHCRVAAFKAKRILFMIKLSFAEVPVSAFVPFLTRVLHVGVGTKPSCPRRLFGANPADGYNGSLRVSAECHMRAGYAVEIAKPHPMCFLEERNWNAARLEQLPLSAFCRVQAEESDHSQYEP